MSEPSFANVPESELEKVVDQAGRSIADIKKRGKFMLFEPRDYQREWFECEKQIVALFAGNRVGKSTCGAIRILMGALGIKPFALGGTMPQRWDQIDCSERKYLIIAESFDTAIAKTIVPKLKEFLAPGMLRGRPKKKQGSQIEQIFYFSSGAEIHIQSYEQHPDTFEGPSWNGAWFDEPPPQRVFEGVRRGCGDRQGWIWITATPLKEPWMRNVIVRPSEDEDDSMSRYAQCFTAPMEFSCRQHYGGHLEHDWIEAYLESLSPEVRAARGRGDFIDLSALAFPQVQEETHLCGDLW